MTSKEIIKNKIIGLEEDYQHYTMVDKDAYKSYTLKLDIEEHQQILKDLDRLEKLEKENQELKEQRLSLSLQLRDYRLIKEITLPNILDENTKLKKVIDILKEEPYILEFGLENFTYDKFNDIYYYEEELPISEDLDFRNEIYIISKEKYNLLSEVLECQKD